jgi:hypothetical protein
MKLLLTKTFVLELDKFSKQTIKLLQKHRTTNETIQFIACTLKYETEYRYYLGSKAVFIHFIFELSNRHMVWEALKYDDVTRLSQSATYIIERTLPSKLHVWYYTKFAPNRRDYDNCYFLSVFAHSSVLKSHLLTKNHELWRLCHLKNYSLVLEPSQRQFTLDESMRNREKIRRELYFKWYGKLKNVLVLAEGMLNKNASSPIAIMCGFQGWVYLVGDMIYRGDN